MREDLSIAISIAISKTSFVERGFFIVWTRVFICIGEGA
jgi:hypothetical protein